MTPRIQRTVLVTGAARRIGRSVSLAFARDGYNIVAHYHRSENEARELVDQIRALNVDAWAIRTNLEDPRAAALLMDRAVSLSGSIDVLVNNAAAYHRDKLMAISLSSLESSIRTNAFSPLVLARNFGNRAAAGVIVNLLDARVTDYDARHVAYHLSKRMLTDLTRLLALELAPRIRVNGVAPGIIVSEGDVDQGDLDRARQANPLKRLGDTHDVTRAVRWLVGNEFVTGQVVFVDGGRHLRGQFY